MTTERKPKKKKQQFKITLQKEERQPGNNRPRAQLNPHNEKGPKKRKGQKEKTQSPQSKRESEVVIRPKINKEGNTIGKTFSKKTGQHRQHQRNRVAKVR